MSTHTPTSPPKRSSRRKMTGEHWDDDFEFSFPSRHMGKNATPRPNSEVVITERRSESALATSHSQGRISPSDSWAGSWEDSPPGPSRLPVRHPNTPSPLNLPPLPRMSSSRSIGLPSPPISRSSSGQIPARSTSTAQQTSYPALVDAGPSQLAQQRSISTGTTKSNSVKRHRSSSYIPTKASSGPSRTTTPSPLPSNSTTRIPLPSALPSSMSRSKSTEQMPPPPLPVGKRSATPKSRTGSRSEVRVSGIPFSPSQEHMHAAEPSKRPGFWKRLSGTFSEKKDSPQDGHCRRRSSSAGVQLPASLPQPPVPPLPLNIRSPSAASSTSNSSASSSNRSGVASALSSVLRRSTSSLSRKAIRSRKASPPSSYPQAAVERTTSSTSINTTPPLATVHLTRLDRLSPPLPHSLSTGFHLPISSPGSPYRLHPLGAALPHSSSYPGPPKNTRSTHDSDTDTETEADGRTPRRKKIRPVSAAPPSKREEELNGQSWSGLPSNRSESAQAAPSQTAARPDLPTRGTSSGFSSSSFKRLSPSSKKHGRRLSGGLPVSESSARLAHTLETVAGSPVKAQRAPSMTADEEEGFEARDEVRAGPVSATNSMIRPLTIDSDFPASLSAEMLAKKAAKERRRQSCHDLPIPRTVREQQKALNAKIGAFKLFAAGVTSLRSLGEAHIVFRDRAFASRSGEHQIILARLDQEFEQWWEMAAVLIELGSTGQADSTQPSVSTSPRSRQVTLTSDDTNSAAEDGRRVSPDADLFTPRKTSLPDPTVNSGSGPPRASPPPEVWRASTGRQDPMSKRQLEILRTMLGTPVDGRPSMISRQASTLSAASAPSAFLPQSAAMAITSPMRRSPMPRSATQSPSISMPSPEDSAYIVSSGSFPSPLTAAGMARQKKPSKTPLAGLKAFLKLKGTRSGPSTPSHPEQKSDSTNPAQSPSPPFPPASASSPSSPPSSEVFSTARSSFSAFSPAKGTSRDTSPVKKHKRPNLENMFRTSSGNWRDLVRSYSPAAQQRERTSSAESRLSKKSTDDPISTTRAETSIRSGPKTPTTSSFDILKTRPWKSPKNHPPLNNHRPASLPPSGAPIIDRTEAGAVDRVSSRRSADKTEGDKAHRPSRKSRDLGLGWPVNDSPPSTVPPQAGPGSQKDPTNPFMASGANVTPSPSQKTRMEMRGATHDADWEMANTGDRGIQAETERQMQNGGSGDPGVVALTPENLPVLLEYLKQCEEHLGEWRRRVEAMDLD